MISKELINQVLGKPAIAGEYSDEVFTQFCIDTRQINKGDLFVALPGEQQNGHTYLPQLEGKNVAAIVETIDPTLSLTQWQVDNTTKAMGDLAKALREQHLNIALIAMTGSCGKTTTKQIVAQICSLQGRTLSSQKSFNNQWGVPITLSQITDQDQFIVQEMGANHAKEIAYVADIAKPDVAMITMIAPVHLEGFGSLDGVANGKSEIFEGLSATGTAIINTDDAYASFLESKLLSSQKVIRFALNDSAVNVSMEGGAVYNQNSTEFSLRLGDTIYPIKMHLLGEHNIMNALGAAACAMALDIKHQHIVEGLQTVLPPERRLVRIETASGWTILDDSYNANPVAMRVAFKALAREKGRKIAVLGDMAECGDQTETFHRQLAHDLQAHNIRFVFCTGSANTALADEAEKLGLTVTYQNNKGDLIKSLNDFIQKEDCILVKSSNSGQFNAIVEAINH